MVARFRAAFDGGSRGNPGAAAWGVAVIDAEGEYVEGHAGALGHATNNVAEYHGAGCPRSRRSSLEPLDITAESAEIAERSS